MDDLAAMDLALEGGRSAHDHADSPVGAVAVGGQVVAQPHDERERTGDPTAHGELLASFFDDRPSSD